MNARSPIKAAVLRCAVYTRKSSDEGLEQDYNSLHAQRDACEAYVRSQIGEGWTLRPDAYDDGGISGGTMERPGLKRLLADIAAGLIDVVVVYKVDRLTRALGDFARIVEQFDAQGVSFVSVTQAFNTTSSMGRLTLNVLLSFAQFEREVTGERIRDKIALSKAKGMWMGSTPPLGYDPGDHTLIVNESEAATVRSIFARYLELGSVHGLARELKEEGLRSKQWTTANGREIGGKPLTRGALFHLLRNRHYLGEVVHRDQTHPGLHPAIVDTPTFEAAQAKLVANQVVRRRGAVKAARAMFTGRVFDGEGRRFSPTFSTGRGGRIHRYYVATDVQLGREEVRRKDGIRRIGADALETLILSELRRLGDRPHASADELTTMLLRIELRPEDTHLVLDAALLFAGEHPELALDALRSRLRPGERVVEEPGDRAALRLVLTRRMQLRGGRTWATLNAPAPDTAATDPTLPEALRRAHELAAAAQIGDAAPLGEHKRRLVRLAYLAPDLQRAILDRRHTPMLTLAALMAVEIPLGWASQRRWVDNLQLSQEHTEKIASPAL